MVKPKKSLVGKRFGRLVVLEQTDDYIYPDGKRASRWLCQCDCGNIIIVNGNSLTGGRTTSCGCLRKENLVGQIFGRLTVIKQVDRPSNRKSKLRYWLCVCSCGSNQTVIVSTSDLKSGHTQSCGCLIKETSAKRIVEQNKKSAGLGKKNKRTKFCEQDGYAYGVTSNTKREFYIDLEDVAFAEKYTWHENDQGYIMSRINGTLVRLHRLLTNCASDMEVDHKNHNTYDNRKANLRIVTHSQNNMNKNSKGVCFDKQTNKYMAYITLNKEGKFLGYFSDENEAIKARRAAEEIYFGEFSYNNSMADIATEVL